MSRRAMLVLGVVGRSSGKEKEKKRVDETEFGVSDFEECGRLVGKTHVIRSFA